MKGNEMEYDVLRWSIAEWQERLNHIFKDVNKQRSESDIFGRMVEMISGIARGVRDKNDHTVKWFSPRALAWILALASKLDIDLDERLWHWYPGLCPHCRKDRSCKCIIGSEKPSRINDAIDINDAQEKHSRPDTIDDWMKLLKCIYGDSNSEVVENLKILIHLQEECGEVHEAIRHKLTSVPTLSEAYREDHLTQEMSDLFAWFCGAMNATNTNVSFHMKELYMDSCPDCHQSTCKCAPDFVQSKILLTGRKDNKDHTN